MHALSRSLGTIRVPLDGLRTIVDRIVAAVPADARVRLVRIAGIRHENKALELASVDEVAALPGLPDVFYDLSISVVATAERPAGATEYRVQLVSDPKGLSLQIFSDDAVWAHGALDVLGSELAGFTATAAAASATPPHFIARMWRPVLAGVLAGAALASAYYRGNWAGATLAGLGAVLWYLIDLIFAVAASPPEPRELPNLAVVIRDIETFAPEPRRGAFAMTTGKVAASLAAVAVVIAVMLRFFPHQAPPVAAPLRASARHEDRR